MEFPRLVYRKNGKEVIHESANDEAQFDELIAAGWFENVPDALAVKEVIQNTKVIADPVIDDNAPPTRAELEIQAKSMGIKFDGRISDKKLLDIIESALKA